MFKIFNKNVFSFIRNFKLKQFCERIKNQDVDLVTKIKSIPDIRTFMNMNARKEDEALQKHSDSFISTPSSFDEDLVTKLPKTFFIETHGCQMNESDTEIITTILLSNNLRQSDKLEDADVILTNTCAIRESAEEKVWNKIQHIKGIKRRNPEKIFGILGCMAERMKDKIFEKSKGVVDIIVGPDAYRDLPKMIDIISKKDENEEKFAMNVQLSLEETYADILPVRKSGDNIRAYVSIMRGCNNMCSFCIVPFTRGRERSRNYNSIEDEIKMLRDLGVKEITLLGQNVNSYLDENFDDPASSLAQSAHENSSGFKELYKLRNKSGLRFADLIDKLAEIAPDVRFRFTSPHPKDFPEKLIDVIKKNNNICKQIHLPAQSGSSKVLKNMRRYYTREAYLNLVEFIRSKMPYVAISSDFISGFCEETEEDFQETLSLLEEVKYDMAFLFAYSMREKTHAYHNLNDNVSEEIKKVRLNKMIDVFRRIQLDKNKEDLGKYHLVLVEGFDRRSNSKLVGRTDTNKLCIFENEKVASDIPKYLKDKIITHQTTEINSNKIELKKGDYVIVRIDDCSNNTLYCTGIAYAKSIKEFYELSEGKPFIEI